MDEEREFRVSTYANGGTQQEEEGRSSSRTFGEAKTATESSRGDTTRARDLPERANSSLRPCWNSGGKSAGMGVVREENKTSVREENKTGARSRVVPCDLIMSAMIT